MMNVEFRTPKFLTSLFNIEIRPIANFGAFQRSIFVRGATRNAVKNVDYLSRPKKVYPFGD